MIEDLIRAVLGMPPGSKKINADLALMRQHSQSLVSQLIPWKEEKELEIMSLNANYTAQKKGLDKILFGSIQSIYFEPMVAFAYKDYVKGVKDALLYCRTTSMEFVFRIKHHSTDVFFNGNQVAVIDAQGIMHGLRSKSPIGTVRPYSSDLLSIIIWGKDYGHIFNPSRPHSQQQRAFYLLSDLNEEEENIFLALGLYEILTRILINKKRK
jgi:hypothetical protein